MGNIYDSFAPQPKGPFLTNSLNMGKIYEVFQRAATGDPAAKAELRNLGKGASEIPLRLEEEVDVTADAPDIPLPEVGMATHIRDEPEQTGAPQSAGEPAAPDGPIPHDWGTILRMAGGGFSSLGHNLGNGRPAEEGMINKLGAERLKADQINALKQRHSMWELAYKNSQELPPEVLSDPKFASLSKAKTALDKDMLDGKIDNEQNVSRLLTELARHKEELDQISQVTKIKSQLAGETQLQRGREEAGLVEAKDYYYDPDGDGPQSGFMTTGSDFATRSTARTERQADRDHIKKTEEMEGRRLSIMEKANILADRRLTAQQERSRLGQANLGANSRSLMNLTMKQLQAENPGLGPEELQSKAANVLGEQFAQLAEQQGLLEETDEGFRFQGKTYDISAEGVATLNRALAQYFTSPMLR